LAKLDLIRAAQTKEGRMNLARALPAMNRGRTDPAVQRTREEQ